MAKFLKDLLGSREPLFALTLQQLEAMTGRKSIDIAYMADITHRAHAVMRSLGLDPADTTALELYKALNAHAGETSLFEGSQDVGLIFDDDQIVSFNYDDIIENQQLTYDLRTARHMQCRVQLNLVGRYASVADDKEAVNQLAHQAKLDVCDLEEYHMEPTVSAQSDQPQGPNILCIGDIFTDAFITLGDETAKIIKEGDTEWLAVPFGRKPPYEKVDIVKSVGPSPNVAVSIARLGYRAGLMAWIGGDATGQEALEHLHGEHVDTESMVVEQDRATSYWYVLCFHADRTMLVKSEKYRYEWRDPAVKPDWIYLAYLGEDSWPLHEGLFDYLQRNPDVKFALQPGTFQFKWGLEKMAPLYSKSNIVLMNREEAMDVTGLPYDSITNLANGLHGLGPETVVITDGPNGSYASQNGRVVTIPNYPDPAPPVERTGAGDAFSSTFVAAIAAGESLETALAWSPINSMNVVQHVGAQKGLLTLEEIKGYLASAPDDYIVKEFQG